MKNDQLTKILLDIGLSENEAKVYLAALALGPATVLSISKAADVIRTTSYSVIESLKKKGLITLQITGFKQLYVAANPNKLENMLDSRRLELKNTLPEFSALYNLQGGEGLIKYYEGLEAIKTIYEDILQEVKPHDDFLVISNTDAWYKLDPEFFRKYIEKRAKLNINIRLLLQDTPLARKHKEQEKNYHETIKFLPKGSPLSVNLLMIPNKLVFHQLIPPITATVIENKSIIALQRELFEVIWKSIPL